MEFDNFVMEYGVQSALIAIVSIILVGMAKIIFKNRLVDQTKEARKAIYQVMTTVIVLGLSAAWILLRGQQIEVIAWLKESAVAYAASQVMYPMYENYHLRDLVGMLMRFLMKEEVKKDVQNSGN